MGILSSLSVQVWIWLVLAVIMMIIEGLTAGLLVIWVAAGCFAGAVTALATDNILIQLLVFGVVTLVTLAVTRPMVKKITRGKLTEATNADALIGQTTVALSDITELDYGEVKISGQVWTASLAEGSDAIRSGDLVNIVKIEGVKLVVEKEKQ